MEYRRAAIPALVGGLLLTALLWWAGASTQALRLPGTVDVLGGRAAAELEHWLTPWSYDPPPSVRIGAETFGVGEDGAAIDNSRYLSLYTTGMQIRFVAVLLFFVPGALLLVRRLPPVNGRVPATLLAVWAWGLVAGTLAVAVSAPWLIAANGRGSYRFLPQLAGMASAGRQILVLAAFVAAVVAVLAARVTAKGAGPLPRAAVPVAAARLAATVGTAVIAVSLVVLSYQPVAATLQTVLHGQRPVRRTGRPPAPVAAAGLLGGPGRYAGRRLVPVPRGRRAGARRGVVVAAVAARPAHPDHGPGDGGRRGLRDRTRAAGRAS